MFERENNVFEMLFRPVRHLPLSQNHCLAEPIHPCWADHNMAVRRQHFIIIAKVTIDRFAFAGDSTTTIMGCPLHE